MESLEKGDAENCEAINLEELFSNVTSNALF